MSKFCGHYACKPCLTKYSTSHFIAEILDEDPDGKSWSHLKDSYFMCINSIYDSQDDKRIPCGTVMDIEAMQFAVLNHEITRSVDDIVRQTKIFLTQHYVKPPKEIRCCREERALCYHSYDKNILICLSCQKIYCAVCYRSQKRMESCKNHGLSCWGRFRKIMGGQRRI